MTGLSTEQELQIRELIAQKQKIAAIKLYREATGSSLRDAKETVDAMEMGAVANFPVSTQMSTPDISLDNRIKRLLSERKKIEAVKVYREAYNCGLKEAKEAVDAIEIQMRMGGTSSMPTTPVIRDDPFAEEAIRSRRILVIFIALLLVALGVFGVFYILR
jgi:ribosomal protein L7/L12